jgi:hypothetical protein
MGWIGWCMNWEDRRYYGSNSNEEISPPVLPGGAAAAGNNSVMGPFPVPVTHEESEISFNEGDNVNYEPTYPNRRNSESGLILNAPVMSLRTEVRILFVRHSESCANMLKKFQKGIYPAHTLYADPELTERGQRMALLRGAQLAGLITTNLGGVGPLYFGASGLRRTQQTAISLLGGSQIGEIVGGMIYALPYISEVGQTADNKVPGPATRTSLAKVNYSKLDAAAGAGGYLPDAERFFEWLGSSEADILATVTSTVRMVIVTHAGWMKKLAERMGLTDARYENLDAMAVTVTYGADRQVLSGPAFLPDGERLVFEADWDALAAEACPDSCTGRGAPICSGRAGSICERLVAVYNNYRRVSDKEIQDLEKDLRIMESYRTSGGRPQVVTALENLRKHGGRGLFGGGRSRDNLPGDLLPVLAAYGCQTGGEAEACQLVREALHRNVNRMNAIPDATIERIANLARTPALRNYTRKTSGWFGTRRGARYTRSRTDGQLRRNLERVRDSVCPPAPTVEEPMVGAVQSNNSSSVRAVVAPAPVVKPKKRWFWGGRRKTNRRGWSKKRLTHRRRHSHK